MKFKNIIFLTVLCLQILTYTIQTADNDNNNNRNNNYFYGIVTGVIITTLLFSKQDCTVCPTAKTNALNNAANRHNCKERNCYIANIDSKRMILVDRNPVNHSHTFLEGIDNPCYTCCKKDRKYC